VERTEVSVASAGNGRGDTETRRQGDKENGESAPAVVSLSPGPLVSLSSAAPPQPLLKAENLHRVLGEGDAAADILKGVNVSMGREYVSIVGASGSGKSTLLYLLGGLDRPTRLNPWDGGRPFDPPCRVTVDGQDTSTLNDVELAALRNAKVGFVFQFHYLLKEFTAQENVALPMFKLGKLSRHDAMDRAHGLLKRFGLSDKATRRANRLSGGEQQRVAVARALANEPAVLLADEPTGNLDRKNSELVAHFFEELSANGQAIVMVTHDTALAQRAQRMITMEDGQIIRDEWLRTPPRDTGFQPVLTAQE
jgi:lipoprotein-releasing system ATP-binding protein